MKGSGVLVIMAFLMATLDYVSGNATDIDHLATYIVFCTAFIVGAIEELKDKSR
jgi:hypothetical protein